VEVSVCSQYRKILAFVYVTDLPDPNQVAKFMLNLIVLSWVGSE